MATAKKTGLLLINLGSPDSPEVGDVRRYLAEFLSDPRVIDMSALGRKLLLNLVILPRRPKASSEAYKQIWRDKGSPLLIYSRQLQIKVAQRLGEQAHVALAMRYGNPSIPAAMQELRAAGVDRIVVFPLYPQYSSAATGSSVECVIDYARQQWNTPSLQFVPAFYDHPDFIESYAELAKPLITEKTERVLFSYHGLPERHCIKSDESADKSHCLKSKTCCDAIIDANRNCYRAQCFATTRALGDALDISPEKRVICFQSRLGRDPWIKPYTDEFIEKLAKGGIKNIAVISPAFVTDCLETLEELGMRAKEDWERFGGEELTLVPCPNATDRWADAVVSIAREHSRWLGDV